MCRFITDQLTGVFATPFPCFCLRVFMEYRTDVTRSGMDVAGYYLIILSILGRGHGNKQKACVALEEDPRHQRGPGPRLHTIPASYLALRMSSATHLLLHMSGCEATFMWFIFMDCNSTTICNVSMITSGT